MASIDPIRQRVRSARGAELLEFAFVLPLLLFVVVGIVDFGFLFQRYEVVTNAAREGARIAVLPGYCTADVQTRVTSYLSNGGVPTVGLPPGTLTISVSDVPVPVGAGPAITGKQVTVTYIHHYLFIGPFASWFGGSFTTVPLTGTSIMRPEATGPSC